jgi:hypothetical protein
MKEYETKGKHQNKGKNAFDVKTGSNYSSGMKSWQITQF